MGIDNEPGFYEGHARCNCFRLSGLSDESDDTIAYDYLYEGEDGRFFVEVLATDKYFRLQHCSVKLVSGSE